MYQLIHKLRSQEFSERVRRLEHAAPQQIEFFPKKKTNPLHIVYVLTHVSVCGGVKVILQHANGLKKMGVKVTLLSHFPKPDWHPIEGDYIAVPFGIELTRAIPLCDVIVATYWDHVNACIETGIAPVVYFEQGDFHLFEPIEAIDGKLMTCIQKQFQLPPHIITISHPVKEIIKNRFSRDSRVFPNALDTDVFYPKTKTNSKKYVMIVGSDKSEFKGIADLLEAFDIVKTKGYDIELLWLTPSKPDSAIGEVFINPSQPQIGELYRKASIYVCGSYYEAFSLPCLEAMACGTPVVTTKTPGVAEYAKDEKNCLMTVPGNVKGIVDRIIRLLTDEELYQQLQKAGIETAKQFSWNRILKDILNYYEQVAQYGVTPKNNINEWSLYCDDKKFEDLDAFENIRRFLAQTEAKEVYIPVEYNLIPNIPVIKWELFAKRNNSISEGMIEKIYTKAIGDKIPKWPEREIVTNIQSGNYVNAIVKARELLTNSETDTLEQGVYIRWVIHCLIELKQFKLAQELLSKTIKPHPFYTDLYYLQAKLAQSINAPNLKNKCMDIIGILQDAAKYPEYYNISKLINDTGI